MATSRMEGKGNECNLSMASEANMTLLNAFKTISLFRLALLESVNLINVIAFLFTEDNSILLIFIIMLILFFTQRPTGQLFISDFNLTDEEKKSVLETL